MNNHQALSSEKRFVSPRCGSNLQPSDNQWGKVQVWHKWKPVYVNNYIDEIYILEVWEYENI